MHVLKVVATYKPTKDSGNDYERDVKRKRVGDQQYYSNSQDNYNLINYILGKCGISILIYIFGQTFSEPLEYNCETFSLLVHVLLLQQPEI
ncbi:hypothetical protein YC2023_087120 [Brassica napus]